MKQEFKVGQKVRVVEGGMIAHYFKVGSVVEVVNVKAQERLYLKGKSKDRDEVIFQTLEFKQVEALLDFTKPVFTAEGTPVEIVSTSGRDPKYPVLGYEGKARILSKFTLEGKNKNGTARRHLTNTQAPEPVETPVVENVRYLNLYQDGERGNCFHTTKTSADAAAKRYTKRTKIKRVGCIKATVVEGRFD